MLQKLVLASSLVGLVGLSVGCAVSGSYAAAEGIVPSADVASPPAAAEPATTAPPVEKADPADQRPAVARQVIYSASYRVVVGDLAGTLRSIQATAEKMGGHLQEVSGNTIIIRIPAARFQDATQSIERLGEVVDRQVRAQDVTEEMRDLNIRLDNAEKLRKRLQDILAKTEKVEDALKVEAELARVSGELDAVKGKIRYLESLIAMSTIRVDLNSPVRSNALGSGPRLPFEWVENVADGLVAGEIQQNNRRAGFFSRGPRFKPPAGYVRYYEATGEVDAMDGSGQMIRLRQHANLDDAAVAFWAKLIRRTLVDGRAIAMQHEEADANFCLFRGTRDVAGKSYGYLLVLKRSRNGLALFEAWGPAKELDAQYQALRASGLSADPD